MEAVLKNRGMTHAEANKNLASVEPAQDMLDAMPASDRILESIKNGDFIVLYTDYDADGFGLAGLADGSVNAMFSGTWDYENVVDALGEENVGIAQLPTYTLADGTVCQMKSFAGSKAIGVNPNSKNPEAAVALAAFLGSTEAQQAHYDMRNIIPTDTSITVDDALAQAEVDTIANTSILQPLVADMGNYWSPAQNMGEELVAGTVTHDNAADKTAAMNEAMNSSAVE
jgi:arabinogalactan oligomer/maltooligosaccharide transport system substrate-binding protein